MNIAIVTDSGSNYYNEDLSDIKGLYAVPLQIIDGDTTYLESVEITNKQVNDLMREEHILTTSLPAIGRIEALFEKIKNDGYDKILAVPITSGISGTINAMRTAANYMDIRFEFIDCYSTFHNALDIALYARQELDKGRSLREITGTIDDAITHSDTIIIPDDLHHLSRGGRLSPLAATLGGFLKIKPILHLNKETLGIIEPLDKVRTMHKAIQTVIENLRQAGVDDSYTITVAHVDSIERLNETVDLLQAAFPNTEIRKHDLISTVSVHCGLGSVALQYMKILK